MQRKILFLFLVNILLLSMNNPTMALIEPNQSNPLNEIFSETISIIPVDSNSNGLIDFLSVSFTYYIDNPGEVEFWVSIQRDELNYYYEIAYQNVYIDTLTQGNNTQTLDVSGEQLYASNFIGNVSLRISGNYNTPQGWHSFSQVSESQIPFDYLDYEQSRLSLNLNSINYSFILTNGTEFGSTSGLVDNCDCIDYITLTIGYNVRSRGWISISTEVLIINPITEDIIGNFGNGNYYSDFGEEAPGIYTATIYIPTNDYHEELINGTLAFSLGGYHDNWESENDDNFSFWGNLVETNNNVTNKMFLGNAYIIDNAPTQINPVDEDSNGLFDYFDIIIEVNSSRQVTSTFWIEMKYEEFNGNYVWLFNHQLDDITIFEGVQNVTLRLLGGQIQVSGHTGEVIINIDSNTYRTIHEQTIWQWAGHNEISYSIDSNQFDQPPVVITSISFTGQYNPNSDQNGYDYAKVTMTFDVDFNQWVSIWFDLVNPDYSHYLVSGGIYDFYQAGTYEEEIIFDGHELYSTGYTGSINLQIYTDLLIDEQDYHFKRTEPRYFDHQDYNPNGEYNPNQRPPGEESKPDDGESSSAVPSLPLPGFELPLFIISVTGLLILNKKKVIR